MNRVSKKKSLISVCLCIMLLVMLSACDGQRKESGEKTEEKTVPALNIECIDVGKADAFVLYTASSCVMIDCGEKNDGKDIVDFLDVKGINRIDYLILSHFDKDHIGGAKKLIGSKDIEKVYVTYRTKTTDKTEDLDEALYGVGIEPETLRKYISFELDGIKYEIWPPLLESYGSDDDSNDSSLIVKVTAGKRSMLFTGDAENRRLSELLQNDALKADILKLPHHGKKENLSMQFVEHAASSYAVITSSDDEKEDDGILKILDELGVKTYLTRKGHISVKIENDEILITQEKSNG